MNSIALVWAFAAVFCLTLAILLALRNRFAGDRQAIKYRLRHINTSEQQASHSGTSILRSEELSQIPLLDRILSRLDFSQKLRLLLSQANSSWSVGQLTLIMLISGFVGLVIAANSSNLLIGAAAFAAGSQLPLLHILRKKSRRKREFERHFPEALDIMANALRAGFSLSRAFQLVAEEGSGPVGKEFQKTHEEIQLGIPIKDALLNLNRTVDSIDVNLFVTAILIQKESGGNLTEILTKIGQTIRSRFKLMGQLRVYTAQGRLSGWLLSCLPLALAIIVSIFNPDYIAILLNDSTGQLLLFAAAMMQTLGLLVISRIVRLKY